MHTQFRISQLPRQNTFRVRLWSALRRRGAHLRIHGHHTRRSLGHAQVVRLRVRQPARMLGPVRIREFDLDTCGAYIVEPDYDTELCVCGRWVRHLCAFLV